MEEKPDLEYLAHYGVKGMKWGIRKAVRRVGRVRRKNKHQAAREKAYRSMRESKSRNRQGVKDLNAYINSQLSKPYDPNWVNNMYAFESRMQTRNVNTRSKEWVAAKSNFQYEMIKRMYL